MGVRGTVGALAVAVALTGCTSDEPPPTTLPPLASEPTAPLDATAPSPPVLAGEATSAGASAFATYYLSLISNAFATGDASAARAVTEASCGTCSDVLALAEAQPEGARFEGGEYIVLSAATPGLTGSEAIVDLSYERPAGRLVGRDGRLISVEQAVPETMAQMRLDRIDDEWRVLGFRVVGK